MVLVPIVENRTVPLFLDWTRAGKGAEDRSCVHTFKLEAPVNRGWFFPNTEGCSGAGFILSLRVPGGDLPQCILGIQGKSSCLLKKVSSTNWAKGQGLT